MRAHCEGQNTVTIQWSQLVIRNRYRCPLLGSLTWYGIKEYFRSWNQLESTMVVLILNFVSLLYLFSVTQTIFSNQQRLFLHLYCTPFISRVVLGKTVGHFVLTAACKSVKTCLKCIEYLITCHQLDVNIITTRKLCIGSSHLICIKLSEPKHV